MQQRGVVHQGSGKPAYLYELTPAAENLFSKAYGPVLHQLLDVLNEQVGYEQSEALLRRVGRRMAGERVAAADSARARLEEAVATLNELGGFAELEEHNTGFIIRSYSCPLYTMVRDHPEVCRMIETLLSELTGIPVHEHCDRGDRPRCCFEVASFGDTT
ncbi:MAG TPA: hypothetical protein VE288_17615 [Rubrobacteraceae bacterium]|nr:hypothetical protein [Rubrobacteraceae bacterium]